jgi:hypothetical protein
MFEKSPYRGLRSNIRYLFIILVWPYFWILEVGKVVLKSKSKRAEIRGNLGLSGRPNHTHMSSGTVVEEKAPNAALPIRLPFVKV